MGKDLNLRTYMGSYYAESSFTPQILKGLVQRVGMAIYGRTNYTQRGGILPLRCIELNPRPLDLVQPVTTSGCRRASDADWRLLSEIQG